MGYEDVPSPQNYQVGGILITLTPAVGLPIDLGNVANFGMDPSDLELLEHFSARSGQRQKDRVVVVQTALKFSFTLDEHHPAIYALYFMGDQDVNVVRPLTRPLGEFGITIVYRNLLGVIWTYEHTRVVVKPAGASDFGDFSSWAELDMEAESLVDMTGEVPEPHGKFTFEMV